MSGLCDSLSSVRICLSPSSCGCHAIFIVCFSTAPPTNERSTRLLDLADKRKLPTVPLSDVLTNLPRPPVPPSRQRSSFLRAADFAGPWLCKGAPHPSANVYSLLRLLFCHFSKRAPLSLPPFLFFPACLFVSPFLDVSFVSFANVRLSYGRCGARRDFSQVPRARPVLPCPGRLAQAKIQRWPMATRADRIAFSRALVTAFIAAVRRRPPDALGKFGKTG